MARKPIDIPIASDTRAFSKGVKDGVIEPLEGVEDALDDLTRESDKTGDALVDDTRKAGRGFDDLADDAKKSLKQVEDASGDAAREAEKIGDEAKDAGRDIERAMRDAQADTDDLKKAHKDLHDVIEKGSKTAYKKMGDASEKTSREASEDVEEFRDEAQSNFSEVASSFTGDMDSAVDLVQGTLGGLAGSVSGPLAIAFGGLAATAGVFYTKWNENAEKAEQRISDMYDDMLDSGESYLSESYQQETYWSILKNESEVISLDKTKEYARLAGVSYETVAMAWAGNHEAMQLVQQGLYDEREALHEDSKTWSNEEAEARSSEIDGINNAIGKHQARRSEIEETTDRVNQERVAWELNGTASAQALKDTSEKAGEVQEALRGYHTALDDLPTDKEVKVKGVFDRTGLDRDLANLPKRHTVTVDFQATGRYGRKIY